LHVSFQSLQQLGTLASGRIESPDDAAAYVRKAVAICGTTDPSIVLPDRIGRRLAGAEWGAANDPNKLVSDGQVAEAFNFMSDEFGVANPARLTASDILQYRSVQASLFPHIFSGKSVSGSRPVGAIVMLYQLWYNGGVTEGVRKAAQLDRPPGGPRVTGGHIIGRSLTPDKNPNLVGREYQRAGRKYFEQRSPLETRSFLAKLATTLGIPEER
jgi:hypothetical protein